MFIYKVFAHIFIAKYISQCMLLLKHVLTFQTFIEMQSPSTHIQQTLLLKTCVILILIQMHANSLAFREEKN